MQIVLTLDGSTATGRNAYYKTMSTILSLLQTNNIGPNALQLFVVHYNGGTPRVYKFQTAADVNVNLELMENQGFASYAGAKPNTAAILEVVSDTVGKYVSREKPRAVWLLGGMKVSQCFLSLHLKCQRCI
jgi:hypothetical protein